MEIRRKLYSTVALVLCFFYTAPFMSSAHEMEDQSQPLNQEESMPIEKDLMEDNESEAESIVEESSETLDTPEQELPGTKLENETSSTENQTLAEKIEPSPEIEPTDDNSDSEAEPSASEPDLEQEIVSSEESRSGEEQVLPEKDAATGNEISQENSSPKIEVQSEVPQLSGLLDVSLLTNTTLTAVQSNLSNGRKQIMLTYTGSGVLDIGLLTNSYIIFNLPPELIQVISKNDLTATYDVPALGILIPILRNRGSFSQNDITINGSQVYMNFRNLLSLNLLTSSNYNFTLGITLGELPPAITGEYMFYSESTSELVDLAIISGNPASATLVAPQLPAAPILNGPIYTTDTAVIGTGLANSIISLRIGNQQYTSQVDAQGNFTVSIPVQLEGTEIFGKVMNNQGYESEEVSATVREPPDTIPPDPPTVEPVYSNHMVVTGTGEANTTIILTINGIEYEGVVDESGNYAVTIPEQEPRTLVTAKSVDAAGNESVSSQTSVIEAAISFYTVPDSLAFETTLIESGVKRVPRQNPDWAIEVVDTRGAGSPFRLLANTDAPLTTIYGTHTLPNALVYVDEQGNSISLSEGPIQVYEGRTEEDPITSIHWEENQGPLVEIDSSSVYAEPYSTTITWTLIDAP